MADNPTPNAAAAVMNFLAERQADMLALLADLVNIDSNSYDKPGVDRVGEVLAAFLENEGITVRREPLADLGEPFVADLPGTAALGEGHVLLMGHRDTVFPTGEAARRPYTVKDGRAYGPGVADMKAGLVMNAFVFAAFHRLAVPHPPLRLLMTGDEEIGTPGNRAAIETAAKGARACFNAEPGRISGNVVTARRGGIFFRVRLQGRAAHAGLDYEHGRSAILALARKIEAWTGLTDREADVTVNVGLVSGGQSVNTIPPWAACEIDLRYTHPEDRERLIAAINDIALRVDVEDTSGRIEIIGEFLPMATTAAQQDLLATYVSSAEAAGLSLGGEHTHSCADSGITAMLGVPTICAAGPVGGKAHSPEEYLELGTVVPRAQALALSILALAGR